jgi:hypothetical protein
MLHLSTVAQALAGALAIVAAFIIVRVNQTTDDKASLSGWIEAFYAIAGFGSMYLTQSGIGAASASSRVASSNGR